MGINRRRHDPKSEIRFITFLFSLSKFGQEMVSSARICENNFRDEFFDMVKFSKMCHEVEISMVYFFEKCFVCEIRHNMNLKN